MSGGYCANPTVVCRSAFGRSWHEASVPSAAENGHAARGASVSIQRE